MFTRYGLHDRVSLVGIDYPHKTLNLYFGAAPTELFEATGSPRSSAMPDCPRRASS